ncbi:hypothetical protein EJ04DRAFT_536398 [Polyplosphaeria fusca]|uniref:Glycosyltransferase 2-like domain-containing protein n=1 Tax=Polyplosphaeria fusca TaxID=682080 RepID=A0A9P4QVH9_9PLEO|nr:hypothetical protein EJ04DRAFT_536398 [Polyplosphaeria fusca]
MPLRADDWVLHLDEETQMDAYSLRACIDFIERQADADLGQGIIHYNAHDFWHAVLPTVGDISRVQDDYGRVAWQTNWARRASLGVHGSFLLLSGRVENAVGWETDVLTEDYWFCWSAMRRGFRIGLVPAIAREVSPRNLKDYSRQRRRWFTGIRAMGRPVGKLTLVLWCWRLLKPMYWAMSWHTTNQDARMPRWFFVSQLLCPVIERVFCAFGILVQDYDAGLTWSSMLMSQLLSLPMNMLLQFVDSYGIVAALLFPEKGFYIIAKS